jgi:hypothetical protein
MMPIWQLLEVNHLRDTPLILVGKMWPGLVDWAKESMPSADLALVNAADMAIPRCVPDANQAIALIRKYHAKWRRRSGNTGTKPARKRKSKFR